MQKYKEIFSGKKTDLGVRICVFASFTIYEPGFPFFMYCPCRVQLSRVENHDINLKHSSLEQVWTSELPLSSYIPIVLLLLDFCTCSFFIL